MDAGSPPSGTAPTQHDAPSVGPDAGLPAPTEVDAAAALDPYAIWPAASSEPPGTPELLVVTVPAPATEPDPILTDDGTYGASAVIQRAAGPGEFAAAGTGSKVNAPLEELANTVNTVNSAQMRERGSVDLSSALSLISGVVPQWSYGGFLYVQSRGFQAATMFDGHRDPRAMIAQSAPQPGIFDLDRI